MAVIEGEAPGAWLQGQREQANVSQMDAAKRAGIHVIQLSRIENGHSGVKRETLGNLVQAINGLSSGWQIDADEAFERFGYAGEALPSFNIGEKARIALLDQNLTPEEQQEIAEEMALAYRIVMERRRERALKDNTQ
jgi:transcriptional regulator with XRE-family HTH domain